MAPAPVAGGGREAAWACPRLPPRSLEGGGDRRKRLPGGATPGRVFFFPFPPTPKRAAWGRSTPSHPAPLPHTWSLDARAGAGPAGRSWPRSPMGWAAATAPARRGQRRRRRSPGTAAGAAAPPKVAVGEGMGRRCGGGRFQVWGRAGRDRADRGVMGGRPGRGKEKWLSLGAGPASREQERARSSHTFFFPRTPVQRAGAVPNSVHSRLPVTFSTHPPHPLGAQRSAPSPQMAAPAPPEQARSVSMGVTAPPLPPFPSPGPPSVSMGVTRPPRPGRHLGGGGGGGEGGPGGSTLTGGPLRGGGSGARPAFSVDVSRVTPSTSSSSDASGSDDDGGAAVEGEVQSRRPAGGGGRRGGPSHPKRPAAWGGVPSLLALLTGGWGAGTVRRPGGDRPSPTPALTARTPPPPTRSPLHPAPTPPRTALRRTHPDEDVAAAAASARVAAARGRRLAGRPPRRPPGRRGR